MTAATTGGRVGVLGRARAWLSSRPGLGRNVVIIAAALVLGVAVAVVIISQEDLVLPWQSPATYYAVFSDAAAVAPGQHQEVRIAGVHVGQIAGATVTSSGQAKLKLQITSSGIKLYRNASALLQAKTPLNEMYVALDPGTPAAPLLHSGDTLPVQQTRSPVEIDQILAHFGPNQQNAQRILLSETNIALQQAAPSLTSDFAALDSTVGSLQPVSQALATRQADIKALVTDLGTIAKAVGGNDQRLATLLSTAQTTLTTLSQNDAGLQQTLAALPRTTDALGSSLPKVQALSSQLNPFLDNLRAADATLPTAIGQLDTTIQQLKPVVDELGPVISDGTPVVDTTKALLVDANPALSDLSQITPLLNPITGYLGYDAPWLQGFFFHTASLGSVTVNTPNGREQVVRALVGQGSDSLQAALPPSLQTLVCPAITSGVGSLPTVPNPSGGTVSLGGELTGECGGYQK
ncbi:MAG TPA: MlaD family protein [Acidimicrobiales bacterium]|nr:MlaD family protein [Acidimicrobiales bacterium]